MFSIVCIRYAASLAKELSKVKISSRLTEQEDKNNLDKDASNQTR